MINFLFPNNFYCKYHAPNAEKLIDVLNKYTEKDIDNCSNEQCTVDRIPLKHEDYHDLLAPSIDLFSKEMGSSFSYVIHNPWLNFYNKGQYQDAHDHSNHDIACVFFVNTGENFSNLYFQDRYSNSLTPLLKPLMNYSHIYTPPNIEAGDILFFPAHMLHGVSQQKSDVVRKTLGVNLNFTPQTYDSIDYKNGRMILARS